jgi:hypothetical protein
MTSTYKDDTPEGDSLIAQFQSRMFLFHPLTPAQQIPYKRFANPSAPSDALT